MATALEPWYTSSPGVSAWQQSWGLDTSVALWHQHGNSPGALPWQQLPHPWPAPLILWDNPEVWSPLQPGDAGRHGDVWCPRELAGAPPLLPHPLLRAPVTEQRPVFAAAEKNPKYTPTWWCATLSDCRPASENTSSLFSPRLLTVEKAIWIYIAVYL